MNKTNHTYTEYRKEFTIILLGSLYITAVASNLYIAKINPSIRDYLYLLTFLLLLITVVCLTNVYMFMKQALARHNVACYLYAISIIIIQLFFHKLDLGLYVRLIGYLASAFLTYIMLAQLLYHDPDLLTIWIKIVAFTSGILALTAIASNLGLNNLFGIPFSDKYDYGVLGLHGTGGILEHPNTLGTEMLLGIACSLYLANRSKAKTVYKFILLLCIFGLFLGMHRGPWLAGGIALIFYFGSKQGLNTKLIYFLILAIGATILLFMFYQYVQTSELLIKLFRIKQGLSGREILWPFGLHLIKMAPLIGYGFLKSSSVKWEYGNDIILKYAPESSFHNVFIDTAIHSGLIVTFFYMLVFIIPVYRLLSCKEKSTLKNMLVFISIAVLVSINFVNYSIGGLRSTSLAMSVFLGVANASSHVKR